MVRVQIEQKWKDLDHEGEFVVSDVFQACVLSSFDPFVKLKDLL